MADEDKEKAEKLAAAKKRFEQLKKEQQKKGKKSGSKKKDEKSAEAKAEDAAPTEDADVSTSAVEEATTQGEDAEDTIANDASRPETTRSASISAQSKRRSESFRTSNGPASPSTDADGHRTQSVRLCELEDENKQLKELHEQGESRLAEMQTEVTRLRETSTEVDQLREQVKDAERLKADLASTQRQLAQAEQTGRGAQRRASTSAPDLTEQLASRTSTIEALELELSNVRNQMNELQGSLSEHDASRKELEDRTQAAEAATASVQEELAALKVSMSFPSDETKAASEDPEALTKRITLLESDLRTANSSLDAAAKRAASLEQKIEALTKLHREANATSQAKDKELSELRSQLKRRDRPSHVRDASEFELGEEETETGALQARIRALEAENFDLRRGVWRDKRAEIQPGMEDDMVRSPEYEDVDLNTPYASKGSSRPQHSTFQDVITSGISAFTGLARETTSRPRGSTGANGRKQSLSLLSDQDDDFDPEAFQLAQEEEAKRRVERVKEVKRGLDKWRGWGIDIAELRANGAGSGRDVGPVFEV